MIRLRALLVALLVPFSLTLADSPSLEFYLAGDVDYDENVPTPRSVLGFEVGDWHARHDQIVGYFKLLADISPRFGVQEYGRSYEERPLILATLSSPENLARIDTLRRQHLVALSQEGSGEAGADRPVIVWLGYSVHGNEASGANAALLLAYHLAAARGPAIDRLLENAIILIDPTLNPDGLARFSTWVNSHRGKQLNADPLHREHLEAWPGGRTNHYWFDLNRDWLFLTHRESRARLAEFHSWKPHVLTDSHEMKTDRTFFFQPGVPSRQNPLTPRRNLALTAKIAGYQARAFDASGTLYYSQESFDDFYYGKGSTYPDLNGSIGILFEQASARGHVQENSYGGISFPEAIRNHLLSSLSTLEAATELRGELIRHQVDFYRSALTEAEEHPVRAYVFGGSGDAAREYHLIDILRRHRIEVRRLARTVAIDGQVFEAGTAHAVLLAQPQFRLIRTLFETAEEFRDTIFYDVSTWTLPLAFDVPYAALDAEAFDEAITARVVNPERYPAGQLDSVERPYAYLLDWRAYYAPRALGRLLAEGIRVRVTTRPILIERAGGSFRLGRGTLIVPLGIQHDRSTRIEERVAEIARDDGVDVYAVGSGLTARGIDLGSPSILDVKRPKPLLVVGRGVSAYEAGEIWHLLDQRHDLDLSLVDIDALAGAELERYTHVILASASYSALGEKAIGRLRNWVRRGGAIVAIRGSLPWVEKEILELDEAAITLPVDLDPEVRREVIEPALGQRQPYGDYEARRARRDISGAIFATEPDPTHPLCFGYGSGVLPVFRNSTLRMRGLEDPHAMALVYSGEPLLSGYASDENLERLAGSGAATARRLGRGVVIRLVDLPNHRGVWYGTNKLLLNALFFSGLIKETSKD